MTVSITISGTTKKERKEIEINRGRGRRKKRREEGEERPHGKAWSCRRIAVASLSQGRERDEPAHEIATEKNGDIPPLPSCTVLPLEPIGTFAVESRRCRHCRRSGGKREGRPRRNRYVEEGGAVTPSSSNCHRRSSPLSLPASRSALALLRRGLSPSSPCSSELVVLLWESLSEERNCRHRCSIVSFIVNVGRSPELLMLHPLFSFSLE
ncbi:uncharacterized protein LOC110271616 [Arachis ipaensis]|uniref:uncharacterized protein LOC110271616 n=1 Tax=Arachis ipaensis TaxID=130454 RepID=UPI000A2B4172|nr:uncharacterized protein LOC110271616 [Arachis ipaensis]